MNVLIIFLMLLIVVLLVVISFALLKIPGKPVERSDGRSDIRAILEKMQDREQAEQDRELSAYAEKQKKHQAVLNPLAGLGDGDERIHQTNMKAEKILIPENLSPEERQVIKDFFDL